MIEGRGTPDADGRTCYNCGVKLHLGHIEPHAALLRAPAEGQRLYKVMKAEHAIASIAGGYLHFNRVDRYGDFRGADPYDGAQLPEDLAANQAAAFEAAKTWTLADYYDQARARTYACCFSLENSAHIWREYARGGEHGKVGVIFDFAKLRERLNTTLDGARMRLGNGELADQIFSVNYGNINYVDSARFRANGELMQNPIAYTFMKDEQYKPEAEMRIALSALGIGKFILRDRSEFVFPDSLQLSFDFRAAIRDGVIVGFEGDPSGDNEWFASQLVKLGITAVGDAVLGVT